ncbi:MAG TPA: response regulator transcription factor [Solirubrobacterales bacterium]|nr:response regulator transcription factor [Solirubrobacterales bacterium]
MTTAPADNRSVGSVAGAPAVAIRAKGGSARERIDDLLTASGYRTDDLLAAETQVLISAYSRAGATACAEVRELQKTRPELLVVLVVTETRGADVRRALQAGARAVVTESSLEVALLPSIKAALVGQITIPSAAGAKATPRLLTTREKQILGLVVMGMTNAAIASQLYLAESTVKSHLSSAFAKLGVSSRAEATSVILDPSAAGLGILTIPTR